MSINKITSFIINSNFSLRHIRAKSARKCRATSRWTSHHSHLLSKWNACLLATSNMYYSVSRNCSEHLEREMSFVYNSIFYQRGDDAALERRVSHRCNFFFFLHTYLYVSIYNRKQFVQINLYTYWNLPVIVYKVVVSIRPHYICKSHPISR